jgi:hypothetical protein
MHGVTPLADRLKRSGKAACRSARSEAGASLRLKRRSLGGRRTVVEVKSTAMTDDGWKQLRAGIGLLTWSNLVRWDADRLQLVAMEMQDVENTNARVHAEYGRLIRWICFSVGTEYLVKGICLLKGLAFTETAKIVRPPEGESLLEWIELVASEDPSVLVVQPSYGTLGATLANKAATIPLLPAERALVKAALRFLASFIRNRDAHRYEQNVRTSHFWAVGQLFVPALNILLASINQSHLAAHLNGE